MTILSRNLGAAPAGRGSKAEAGLSTRSRRHANGEGPIDQRAVSIFASHSHEYQELARDFKRSIESIQSRVPLKVYISEEMPGGAKWRSLVRSELRVASVFVLLYPHSGMRMDWCSYELGVFQQDKDRPIVCIRNIDIPIPPDITDEWQAYSADDRGIRKFLLDLFVQGAFTGNNPIAPEVGVADSEARRRSEEAAESLKRSFARARIRRDYFTHRISVEAPDDQTQPFDLETDLGKAIVTGDERALQLLSLKSNTRWNVLQELAESTLKARWPNQLVEALKGIKHGPIPPPFTPFRARDQRIYVPVITRAESVDQHLRKINLIFVEADVSQMRAYLDVWVPPAAMPPLWPPLVRLFMILIRARWEYIVPMYGAANALGIDEDAARELLERAKREMNVIESEATERGLNILEGQSDLFDHAIQAEIEALEVDYASIRHDMRAASESYAKAVPLLVERLITNNTQHIRLVGKQFSLLMERLTRVKAARSGK
jgi:hypothetical protein